MWVAASLLMDRLIDLTSIATTLKYVLMFGVLSVLTMTSGCATIPNEVGLSVQTVPTGTNVVLPEEWSCTTPCTQTVTRESQFSLKAPEPGYRTKTHQIEVPTLERSNRYRNIGAGLGFLFMYLAADLSDSLGSALISAIVGEDLEAISTGEKVRSGLIGGLIFGGIGTALDRRRNFIRATKPIPVQIELEPTSSTTN